MHYFEIAPTKIKMPQYTHTSMSHCIIPVPSVDWGWLVTAELAASQTALLVKKKKSPWAFWISKVEATLLSQGVSKHLLDMITGKNVMASVSPWDDMINDNVAKTNRDSAKEEVRGDREGKEGCLGRLWPCWLVVYVHDEDKADTLSPTLG